MKEEFTHRFIEDVERIQEICKTRGYDFSLVECQIAWDDYSDSMCAGWMHLPKENDNVWGCVNPYLNLHSGLKDKIIITLVESHIGIEIEDYNIQGVTKEGDITHINLDVKPKISNGYIGVEFSVKRPPDNID